MSRLTSIFGADAGLFGPGLRLLKGAPTQDGKARAGRLSVDVKRRKWTKQDTSDKASASGDLPKAPAKGEQREAPAYQPPPKGAAAPAVRGAGGGAQGPRPAGAAGRSNQGPRPAGAAGRGPAANPARNAAGRTAAPAARAPAGNTKTAQAPAAGKRPAVQTPALDLFSHTRGAQKSAPAKTPAKAPAGNQRRGLAGILGDVDAGGGNVVPFHPNGQAWITTVSYPLYNYKDQYNSYLDPSQPILFPDGTPVVSRFWLPKLNLAGLYDPRIPNDLQQGGDMYEAGQSGQGRGGFVPSPKAGESFGGQPSFDWIYDPVVYSCNHGGMSDWMDPIRPVPSFTFNFKTGEAGPVPYQHAREQTIEVGGGFGCDLSHLLSGYKQHLYYLPTNFDWSQDTPSNRAAPWLYFNLFDPVNVAWTVADAEFYRADGQRVTDAGEPTELPGTAWLALDVLDALATGAHGMPKVIADDGSFDGIAFSQWLGANPSWIRLFNYGPHNQAMLAIINDLGPTAGEVIHQPDAPPPDTKDNKDANDRLIDWMKRNQKDNTPPPDYHDDTPPPDYHDDTPPPDFYDPPATLPPDFYPPSGGGSGYYDPARDYGRTNTTDDNGGWILDPASGLWWSDAEGLYFDEESGLYGDPASGLWLDVDTGYWLEEESGQWYDETSGYWYDPASGQWYDPAASADDYGNDDGSAVYLDDATLNQILQLLGAA